LSKSRLDKWRGAIWSRSWIGPTRRRKAFDAARAGRLKPGVLEDLLVSPVSELVAAIGVGLVCPDRQHRLEGGDQELFSACCSTRPGCTARRVRADGAEPEDDGQLAFSVTAVERTLRTDRDDPRSGPCWWPTRTMS